MNADERRPPSETRGAVLMIEGRAARTRRMHRAARRRRLAAATVLVLCSLLLGGWLIARGDDKAASRAEAAEGERLTRATVSAADQPTADPTPLFASYKDIGLRVPVSAEDLIDIAFHQASYSYARHLATTLPTFATDSAAKKRGTGRTVATNVADEQGWLEGFVLRLWRDRPGKPDSAADVAAASGSPVLSPVDGTVLLVKEYKLYGKYDDVQIHIRPDGHEDLDLVMIHVAKPQVVVGDRVVGGVTQVGQIRHLSNKMRLQIGDFTTGEGDHVHVQLNQVKPGTTEAVTDS